MTSLQTDLQFSIALSRNQQQSIQPQYPTSIDYNFINALPFPESSPSGEDLSHVFEPPTTYKYFTALPPLAASPTSPPSICIPAPASKLRPIVNSTPPPRRNTSARSRPENYIPRPRNAFMIFRSAFWAEDKISPIVERDHRHISRIVGHCWNQLPEGEKDKWRRKAVLEKVEHEKKYPGYRFSPASRTKKPVKRNVKRNGKEELLRCRQVAELLLAGKQGDELDTAVRDMKIQSPDPPSRVNKRRRARKTSVALQSMDPIAEVCVPADCNEVPVFRSPLLPPTDLHQAVPPPLYTPQLFVSSPTCYHPSRRSQEDVTFLVSPQHDLYQEEIQYQESIYTPQHDTYYDFLSLQSVPSYEFDASLQECDGQMHLVPASHLPDPAPDATYGLPQSFFPTTSSEVRFGDHFNFSAQDPQTSITHADMLRSILEPIQWDFSSLTMN